MSLYSAWRVNGGPTQHAPNPTAVTVDVLEVGFIFAIVVLAFCFMLVVPGYRGIARVYFCCRVVMSLFIGSAVLLGVLGQEWESAEIRTHTAYKAYTGHEIEADVGIRIGLAAVNITLKANPIVQSFGPLVNETINYNDRYHWDWRQGRLGFGPYSGKIQQEFRASQFRGAPLPILWIAEYFVLDGELIRWGRSYRTAGWFTWVVLWTGFPTWIIANILSAVVLFYAGFMFLITGGLMLISAIIWGSIKWGHQPLAIPFENDTLYTHYGPSFWLVVSGGIISCLYGIGIICMDLWLPQTIADFFGNDVLQDAEEFFHSKEEEEAAADDVEAKKPSHRGGVQKRTNRAKIAIGGREWVSKRRKGREYMKKELNLAEKEEVRYEEFKVVEGSKPNSQDVYTEIPLNENKRTTEEEQQSQETSSSPSKEPSTSEESKPKDSVETKVEEEETPKKDKNEESLYENVETTTKL